MIWHAHAPACKVRSGGRARTQRSGLREDASNQRAASFSARAHKAKGPLIEGESDGEPRVSGPDSPVTTVLRIQILTREIQTCITSNRPTQVLVSQDALWARRRSLPR